VTWLRTVYARIRGLGRSGKLHRDLREEIRGHLDEATEEYLQQGLSPEDARRAALRSFGNVVQVEDAYRDVRGHWWRDLSKDVSYAVRMLRSQPAFATIAVLSLAVGIGANTAIFSIVNSLLLRPRPFANPEQIVELYTGYRDEPYQTGSYPAYLEFRDRNEVFTGLAAYSIRQFRLGDANEVEHIWGEVVSTNYFDVVGVPPLLGRDFAAEDEAIPERNQGVVISHGLWRRRFNGDPGLVGQPITINGHKLTLIGIAPPHYTGLFRGLATELWMPIVTLPTVDPGTSAMLTPLSQWLVFIGRLKPGTTLEQAQTRFDLLSREMQAAHPEEWRPRREDAGGQIREKFVTVLDERATRLHPDLQAGAFAVAALVGVVVNLVLLIACMNMAGMLLARAVVRRKEIAVRLALGASRLRVVRQLVTESVLLSLLAGAGGVVLTIWLLNVLVAWMPALPEGFRIALDLQPDWTVLVYAIVFSTMTGILFGLAPALQSSRTEVSTVLKDDSSAVTGGYRKSRSRTVLLVAQVAFSLLLLIAAGLMLRSLDNVRPTRLGFTTDNVLVASLNLDGARYDRNRSQQFFRELSDRVSSLPGVQAVSLVQGMPGGFLGRSRRSTEIEGFVPGPDDDLQLDVTFTGPRYFTNMKVPIVQGRDFDDRDHAGAPCVAIVNEALVQRYFAKAGSPLGKHLAKFEYESGRTVRSECEIVGVIRDDDWQSLQKVIRPFYALALLQTHRTSMTLLVNTHGNPANQIMSVRRAILAGDPYMPVNDVQTLTENFSTIVYPFRVLAFVLGACGATALLLATIGIYGTVSYAVAQRTREVGIRMALGAAKSDILKRVVGDGMLLVAVGLTLGLLLSLALTRVLTSSLFEIELLFGVSATDAVTFGGVTVILALVALLACYVPARRATAIDPLEALRYE
jgi:predicted permease